MICAIQYVKTYNYLEWCDSVEQDGCFIKAKNVRVFSDVKPNVEIVQRVDWEDWRDYDLGFYNNHIVVKGVTIVPERLIRISEIVCITSYDEAHETFLTVEQAQEEANARQLQANMENSASLAFTLSKAFRFWREHQAKRIAESHFFGKKKWERFLTKVNTEPFFEYLKIQKIPTEYWPNP